MAKHWVLFFFFRPTPSPPFESSTTERACISFNLCPCCSFFGVLYFWHRLVGCIYFLCLFFWFFCYTPRAWLYLLYINNGYTYQISLLSIMFGWGENMEDGKQREENRVENSVFHCLAKEGKCGGRKTREKVFSPWPTFHPPKSGGKGWWEKCSHSTFTQVPSLSQRSQQLSKEEEDNFPTTNSTQPNYHHRNPKIAQNQHKTT